MPRMPSNSPHQLPHGERRPDRRRRSLLGGRVAFDDGKKVFDCTIRDVSSGGARITIPESETIPPRFHLINMRDRVVHECAVAWLKGGEAGLTFLGTLALGELTGTRLDYMRTLWLERAAG
jgi:hypothetical protein